MATAVEAGALGHSQAALAHLLLGILRVEKCVAAKVPQAHGGTILALREETIRNIRWAG